MLISTFPFSVAVLFTLRNTAINAIIMKSIPPIRNSFFFIRPSPLHIVDWNCRPQKPIIATEKEEKSKLHSNIINCSHCFILLVHHNDNHDVLFSFWNSSSNLFVENGVYE